MLFIGTIVPFEVFSADLNNPEIQKLIAEKQQKIAALEKCSKKVKGFKIAGISTIGLTAVGVGGNIALANKREDVSNQLTNANQTLSQQQAKAREKEECDKNPAKEWKDGECKDKVTPPATNGNNNPETPETTITNNNENVEAEVDIDENQQGEEIVQEVVTTTNTDEDAKKRLAEQKRLEELDSLYFTKIEAMEQKADKYEEQYSKYYEKHADCETSLEKIAKMVEDIKREDAFLSEYRQLKFDLDERDKDILWLFRDIITQQTGVAHKLSEASKAYKAEVEAHSESNITTMDNALSEIESNLKKIEQMFGELQKDISEMCAANEKIKKDLHL